MKREQKKSKLELKAISFTPLMKEQGRSPSAG